MTFFGKVDLPFDEFFDEFIRFDPLEDEDPRQVTITETALDRLRAGQVTTAGEPDANRDWTLAIRKIS
jgi:hypothetical protein